MKIHNYTTIKRISKEIKPKLNAIIFNENLKICCNCYYFKKYISKDLYEYPDENINLSKCLKFGYKNMVSGEIEYDLASKTRDGVKLCGKNGIFFTPTTSLTN